MNEEKLLREFIAALETLWEVWKAEPDAENGNPEAESCDMIMADDIDTYYVKDKLAELKKRLWSLPI